MLLQQWLQQRSPVYALLGHTARSRFSFRFRAGVFAIGSNCWPWYLLSFWWRPLFALVRPFRFVPALAMSLTSDTITLSGILRDDARQGGYSQERLLKQCLPWPYSCGFGVYASVLSFGLFVECVYQCAPEP